MSNSVTVVGNLTRDPELRFTPAGAPITTFGIAVNRRYQVNGEWQEQTSFFDVTCWRDLAHNVAESLEKGSRCIVSGRLEQRSWEDRETHERRSKVEIVADEVGPSLRWATAEVKKADRRGGADEGGFAARPVSNEPAPAASSGGGYDASEEPF
jgi:single-strand DNA-binding protein